MLIEHQQQLDQILPELEQVDLLTIDTEFIRTKTYYAKFALLQIYDGNNTYLIDPVTVDDLSALWTLLAKKQLVFHSFGEDIELLKRLAPKLSERIFDTQIACAFLGHGISLGYAAAIEQFLNIKISKSQSRTDWLQRPLTAAQLRYAAEDVVYLYQLYQQLLPKLQEAGLYEVVLQECAFQVAQRNKPVNLDTAYLDIKNSWQLTPKQLSVLQRLAHWRLALAIKKDMALGWIVKPENLLQVAKLEPSSMDALTPLLHPKELRIYGRTLLRLVNEAQQIAPEQWPEPVLRPIDLPDYKKTLKNVKQLIKAEAEKNAIPAELFASKKGINQYLMWKHSGADIQNCPALLRSWRKTYLAKVLGH